MLTIKDFTVGDTVILEKIGYLSRNLSDLESKLITAVVEKIGRKYITVRIDNYNDVQFEVSDTKKHRYYLDQKNFYEKSYRLYKNRQDVYDRYESYEIERYLSDYFRYGNNEKLPIAALKEISSIIKANENK